MQVLNPHNGANLKPFTRPRKSGKAKRQRVKVQRRRLIALGVAPAKVVTFDLKVIRALLRHPVKTAKMAALAAAKA